MATLLTERPAIPVIVLLVGAALILSAVPADIAHASGFSSARFGGEHGNPTESNPASIYYNPGGIGLSSGTNLMVDLNLVWRDTTYDRPSSSIDELGSDIDQDSLAINANSGEASLNNFLVSPMLGITTDFGIENSPLVAGFAFYAPFGGQAVWGEEDGFKNSPYPGAVDGSQRWYSIEGTIRTLAFTLGAAYQIKPYRLSLGLSGSFYVNEINTLRARNGDGTDHLVDPAECPTGESCLDDDGNPVAFIKEGRTLIDVSANNIGLGVGLLWEPVPEKLWLGLSYQSQPGLGGDIVYEGKLTNILKLASGTSVEDVKFTQQLPDIIRLGARFRPSPDLELRLFADYTRWSVMDDQCLISANTDDGDLEDACKVDASGNQVNGDLNDPLLVVVRNWDDAFGVRAGASYWLMDRDLEVILGAGYDGSAVPDDTLEPALIDMDKFSAALGAKYQIMPSPAFMVTGTNIFYTERDTTGTPTANSYSPNTRPRQPGSDGIYNQNILLLNTNMEMTF